MTTRLHPKSGVKSGLRPPCLNSGTNGSGHAQWSLDGLRSAPPRYDVKPARFTLNQGSRKICSGGVTCPGLIRCVGLEKGHCKGRGLCSCPYRNISQLVYLLTNWLAYLYERIQSSKPDVMPDRREGITRAAGFVFACIDTQTS